MVRPSVQLLAEDQAITGQDCVTGGEIYRIAFNVSVRVWQEDANEPNEIKSCLESFSSSGTWTLACLSRSHSKAAEDQAMSQEDRSIP